MEQHAAIVFNIIKNISPDLVLEIGIRSGVSSKFLMQGMAESSFEGEYHGCDINENIVRHEICKNTTFHIMKSDDLAKIWNKPIDVLFIDGDHSYEQVKKDYENFIKYVNINGFIFFHDTYPPTEEYKKPSRCGTAYKILEDLRRDGRVESITFPYSFGLTICRKIK